MISVVSGVSNGRNKALGVFFFFGGISVGVAIIMRRGELSQDSMLESNRIENSSTSIGVSSGELTNA